ncbi:MAG TPA: cytochrome c family protein [Patescibacteria group bacterium]|nr:cytochrome c family protein [Patescibacteria group bacterium]
MKGTRSLFAALCAATMISAAAPAFAAGDAAAGEKIFNQCKACHSPVAGKNLVGPSLFGVVGRKAGSIDGFKYSDAVKNSGVTWTAENLDKWLSGPKDFIAGNKMTYPGVKDPVGRENVIAYLATLK